jgi:hypothetical protein
MGENNQFLLPFLANHSGFKYAEFDYPLSPMEKLCDIFRSKKSIDSDPRVGIPLILAKSYAELFEEIGFWGFPLKKEVGAIDSNVSETEVLGWVAKVVSFSHVIFEVGDANHHVRIDMKETWLGHRLAYQIDQVTLWDKSFVYDIPCAEGADRTLLEGLIGTVDLTVQAIQNGDDAEGIIAFAQIDELKGRLTPILRPRNQIDNIKARP